MGGEAPRLRRRPGRLLGTQRAQRRTAALAQGAGHRLCARTRLSAPGAHRAATDRGPEEPAAAHQPDRAGNRAPTAVGELVTLEQQRRTLREKAMGPQT